MGLSPAIIHLIGYPATGKYTVAKAVVAAARAAGARTLLQDNHASGNLILSVIDGDGTKVMPSVVWERVGELREIVYRTIEELSPPDRSFVFTNVLKAGDAGDEATLERVAAVAAARHSIFLPVHVTCERARLLERVPSPERHERHKWIDPEAVGHFIDSSDILDLSRHQPFDVDTTTTTPEESARRILDEWARRSAT